MQRRTVVVVTSHHRKVRGTYAARTQCILLDTPMVKIVLHSIAADTLWIRKVRYRYVVASIHTPHIRDRYSYCIAISYAIEPQTGYVRVTSVTFVLTAYAWCMYGESKLLRTCGDFFKHVQNNRHTLSNPCE